MANNNALGIVFSSAYDENIREMTGIRTMGSIPFAGRYRLIDFVLSNFVNSGIDKVGVITKSNYQSLLDHLGSGKAWDLSRKNGGMTILPPFNLGSGGMYASRIEALDNVMNYIRESGKDTVVMTDCNVVCNTDFDKLIDYHNEKGADITIACAYGDIPALEDRMILNYDGNGRIADISLVQGKGKEGCYSMNIFVVSRALLERLIQDAKSRNQTDFTRDIILANLNHLKIFAYKVEDYVETIDSLQKYYEVSMKLVNGESKKLFVKDRPVYTKVRDNMPATYGIAAKAENSLVADGCIIKGTVKNCILFRGVVIEEGAEVSNSIIMQGAFIGRDSKVNCAILDKSVVVKPGTNLSGAETYPIFVGKKIVV